jgi:hypothetical protein
MPIIQETIHKLEVAGGLRYARIGLALLAVIGGTVWYNVRCFRNMASQEAMDSAQLARNIAQGKGYTTSFIRPFSMFLLRRHNEQTESGSRTAELTRIKDRHPDIANPPVYPFLLAAAMKVLPFKYALSEGAKYSGYQPDMLISVVNQVLFFALIISVFLLARRLFDAPTAWLAAALLFGAEVLWRFTFSGLSTMLLLLILSGIMWCLVLFEERVRNQDLRIVPLVVLPFLAGLLCGVGGLTRYSFLWLIIPTVAYLAVFGSFTWRWIASGVAVTAFLIVISPWLIRNYQVSGTPLGVPGYAIFSGTPVFPDNVLERSLQPDFTAPAGAPWLTLCLQKALGNLRQLIREDLFTFCGGFVTAFFLVGLLVVFPNPAASRLRYFVLATLVLLMLVQSLGRTYLSDDSPEVNSENLLILVAPFLLLFGVHFFWLLLDQIYLPFRDLRYVVIGLFCFLCCLPMLFNFLPPRPRPIVYPPYYPFYIQRAAGFVKEDDLTMCDIPWAMAWYGQAQSIWATPGYDPLFEIDSLKKNGITELYLTGVTMNGNFFSKWHATADAWGDLFLRMWGGLRSDAEWPREQNITLPRLNGPPASLPLHYLQAGWPQECLLTSRRDPAKEAQKPPPATETSKPNTSSK